MKYFLIILVFLSTLSFHSYSQYSIQNRWNLKASVSMHRSNDMDIPFITIGDPIMVYKPRFNARVDFNYGILNCLEIGVYLGFMRHYANRIDTIFWESYPEVTYAPTFGINVNFHLLPLWVKNENSRWELYLTAKYGGVYLIKWYGYKDYNATGAWHEFDEEIPTFYFNLKHYRHEFGLGIGGGVYFWKVFGVYAEFLVGKFSYFHDMKPSYYTARIGAEVKFTPKRKIKS